MDDNFFEKLYDEMVANGLIDINCKPKDKKEKLKIIKSCLDSQIDTKTKAIDYNDGIWIKYTKGDHKSLFHSDGRNLWFKEERLTDIESYLDDGYFFILYYTKDSNNEYKIPRILIKLGNEETYVCGAAKNFSLEANMEKVLEEKLKEFSNVFNIYRYEKEIADMKLLTSIYDKNLNGVELTLEELKFLYQIEIRVSSFGYDDDPRISGIIKTRDKRKDLSLIFGCRKNEIAFNVTLKKPENIVALYNRDKQYAYSSDKKTIYFPKLKYAYHLFFDKLIDARGFSNLEIVDGVLSMQSLTSADGLENLRKVGGLYMNRLVNARGLRNLEIAEGSVELKSLTNADGLEKLRIAKYDLVLPKLIDARGLSSLEIVDGVLSMESLTSADGLENLRKAGGLYMENLVDARGLRNLEKFGGSPLESFDLSSLTKADGLEKLRIVECYLKDREYRGVFNLSKLIDARGLSSLEIVETHLDLSSLAVATGLENLRIVKGNLILPKLIDARGLSSLEIVEGDLNLSSLTNVDGLDNLRIVKGKLILPNLVDARGLRNLEEVNGIDLNSLTSVDDFENLDPNLKDIIVHNKTLTRRKKQ